MHDIISIGDTTLDVFLEFEEASLQCNLREQECLFCLDYADKIPVQKLTKIPAVGNAANLAVGASRLGLKSALYTILGDDDVGQDSQKILKKEGVSQSYIRFDSKSPTNYSVVLNYKGERTILVYHELRKYKLPRLHKTDWIYYTSLGEGHESLQDEIEALVKKKKIKLGFNPGSHQLRAGVRKLIPLMKVSEVFLVNKQEAEDLVGDKKNIKALLKKLHERGPKIVVITDGKNGSYVYNGEIYYHLKIKKVPVVEMTGAGDAFSTGFIAALINKKGIREAMRWGTLNSASVVQEIGAQRGLLTVKEMKKQSANNKNLQPEII